MENTSLDLSVGQKLRKDFPNCFFTVNCYMLNRMLIWYTGQKFLKDLSLITVLSTGHYDKQ